MTTEVYLHSDRHFAIHNVGY